MTLSNNYLEAALQWQNGCTLLTLLSQGWKNNTFIILDKFYGDNLQHILVQELRSREKDQTDQESCYGAISCALAIKKSLNVSGKSEAYSHVYALIDYAREQAAKAKDYDDCAAVEVVAALLKGSESVDMQSAKDWEYIKKNMSHTAFVEIVERIDLEKITPVELMERFYGASASFQQEVFDQLAAAMSERLGAPACSL